MLIEATRRACSGTHFGYLAIFCSLQCVQHRGILYSHVLFCNSQRCRMQRWKKEGKKTYCKDAVNVCLHKSWNAYICECSAGGKCYIKGNRFIRASPRGFCVVAVNIFLLSILSSMARNCRGQVKSWASRSLVHASYLCRCRKNRACYIAELHTVWILTYGFEQENKKKNRFIYFFC